LKRIAAMKTGRLGRFFLRLKYAARLPYCNAAKIGGSQRLAGKMSTTPGRSSNAALQLSAFPRFRSVVLSANGQQG
jgi:hypothetical protein